MRKIVFLFLTAAHIATAQPKDVVPNISFNLINAPMAVTSMSALKGKIVVIEFWATWCGSCITAMPHLNDLQNKYPDRLRIVSVSSETPGRIKKFLRARPSNVWFASDTADIISGMFPHRLIPHTVLISPEGNLVANISPESLTEETIEKLLRNEPVTLTEKTDNTLTYEQLLETNFYADDTVSKRFIIQPSIPGAPGFSTNHLNSKTFSGRRITAVNCDIANLYRLAYGNFPYNRTVDNIPARESKSYCIDIIAEDKAQLLPQLKNELAAVFDITAVIRNETKDVYALRVADPIKLKTIPLSTSGQRTYYARHGEVDQQGMTLSDLADYLESYGVTGIPVVDETKITNRYDIRFSFQPEDPTSLNHVLADRGLVLEKTKRQIAILYLQ